MRQRCRSSPIKETARWICSTFPPSRHFRDRLPQPLRQLSLAGLSSAAGTAPVLHRERFPSVKSSTRASSRKRGTYADALVSDKSEISKLVDLFALIGDMKILSSDEVIEAAEKAGRLIVDTYLSPPNREFADLPELMSGMDPVRDFSEACRHELPPIPRAEILQPCRCFSPSDGSEAFFSPRFLPQTGGFRATSPMRRLPERR